MYISFSDIPGQPNLFLDYLYEFDNVKGYYSEGITDLDNLRNKFQDIIDNHAGHIDIIEDIIADQYYNSERSKITDKNIKLLGEGNTVVISTGQQLGIFTGPLYTIYKAITAIKLADYFRIKYDDFNFVPVFWLAGDDHDFEEVRSIQIIDNENRLQRLTYNDGLAGDINRGSLGNLKLSPDIERVLQEMRGMLRPSEFTDELFDMLDSYYKTGETFSGAFKNLMMHFFDEYGLIVFNPEDRRVKELLKPVFLKEIAEYSTHADSLVSLSAELEDVYHAQVKVKPVNLFMNYDGGRYLIEPADEGFRLKGKRKKFTSEELLNIIEESPADFSPNVLLRPVCQDFLFPNAFYVGGPSEISYYAQLKPLYNFYSLPYPIVYPRSSATIIDGNISKLLNKFNLEFIDFLMDQKLFNERILNYLDSNNINRSFDEAIAEIENVYEKLTEEIIHIDKSLLNTIDKNKERTLNNIQQLRSKVEKAAERRYEDSLRQIDKARTLIYPNNNLQERELNIIYFLNKYGPEFIKEIYSQLNIHKLEHTIIEM